MAGGLDPRARACNRADLLMDRPAEIVAAEDVPADLIPVADEAALRAEVEAWKARILKGPNLWDRATRGAQDRINRAIPERIHAVVTAGVEQMTKGIMTGSDWIPAYRPTEGSLAAREAAARRTVGLYRGTASVEGGVAGAGGFLLAAADFPALVAIKLRMLGEIVARYGWTGGSPRERLFVLHIFHLAFASARRRPEALARLQAWIDGEADPETYDWRTFQIEYRDHIDLAKLMQLVPVIGAPVGAVVNWRLVDRLGETAVMACRMRWLAETVE